MAKLVHPLSDASIQRLVIGEKKTDGHCKGLMVERMKDGRIFWRIKFKAINDAGELAWTRRSLGEYPETTLEAARKAHKRLYKALESGWSIDDAIKGNGIFEPGNNAEDLDLGESFGSVFELWAENRKNNKSSKAHNTDCQRIKNYILPHWKSRPIKSITAADAITILKKVYQNTEETSHRICALLKDLWSFAKLWKKVDENEMAEINALRDIGRVNRKNFDAITEPKELALFLKTLDGYKGEVVKIALTLSAHCFLRSTELRYGRWSEVDFEEKRWNIPADRMKMKQPHVVPLSEFVILQLRELEKYRAGDGELMFPSRQSSSRPISDMILSTAIHRMGFEATQHGFRATFRTLGSEVLEFPNHLQEHQLAHAVKDPNGTAYNRTKHLPQRLAMMNAWSEYLECLREGV